MAICKRVIEGHLWVDSGRSRPVSLAMPCARKGLLVVPDLKILRGIDRSIATGRAVNHWDCGLGRDYGVNARRYGSVITVESPRR
jgi:hypothetical protein